MKLPVRADAYGTWDGLVIRRIVDADNREIVRGDDSEVLNEIARAINAAGEPNAMEALRAQHAESIAYYRETLIETRDLLNAENVTAIKALRAAREELKTCKR